MNRASYNSSFGWRNSPSSQDQQSDRKILDLIEKIRKCKPYLQKRLKHIEDSGQLKLRREEVKDITYYLEIAQEVRADVIYGVDTLEVVHEKMMEMIRLNPIQGAFTANRVTNSDEDSDDAPRSPSPGFPNDDFGSSGTRIIPLEKSQSDNEWSRSKDFLTSPASPPPPPRSQDRGYDRFNDNRYSNEWSTGNSESSMEFSRRGDTDMRVAFDSYSSNAGMMGRGRGICRPAENPRLGTPDNRNNSPWQRGSSPWDPFHRNKEMDRPRGTENEDSPRDYDYRDARTIDRDRSPDRARFRDPRDRGDRGRDSNQMDGGRTFYRDQDFREVNRNRSRSTERDHSSDRERSRDSDRDGSVSHGRSNDRGWPGSRDRSGGDRSPDRDRSSSDSRGYDYQDRDSRDRSRDRSLEHQRRNDFANKVPNRDSWSNSNASPDPRQHNLSGHNSNFNMNFGGIPPPSPFMMNQSIMGLHPQQQPNVGPSNRSSLPQPNMNRQQPHPPVGGMDRGMEGASPRHIPNAPPPPIISARNPALNAVLSQQSQHSPPQFSSSIQARIVSKPRQPLLPTPPALRPPGPPAGPHFNPTYQSPILSPQNPAMSPNIFEQALRQPAPISQPPPMNVADIANQFRQKAQQHFAKVPRPRFPPPPGRQGAVPAPTTPAPPSPAAATNSIPKPNVATNQIVAALPSDPRRRNQLQKLQQQQQQAHNKLVQESSSNAPLSDPRKQRQASPTKDKSHAASESESTPTGRKREGSHNHDLPLRQSLKKTVERVRETVAKEIPRTSKLQELRKSLSKQGYHRLGNKKGSFEEVSINSPQDKSKESSPTSSKHRGEREKSSDDSRHKNSSSSPTRQSRSRESRSGKSERSSRHKDRKSSHNSDDDEVDSSKTRESTSSGRSTSTDDADKESKRRTRRTTLENVEGGKKSSRESPQKNNSEDGVITCQKINSTFRIPKIKRIEPPPPPREPTPPPVEEITLSPSPPSSPRLSPERADDHHVNHENIKDVTGSNKEVPQTPITPISSKGTVEPEPLKSSTLNNEETSNGTESDLLLRQFMLKSVGLAEDVLEQIFSNPCAMEKMKSLLKNHVSEIVSKDSSDAVSNSGETGATNNNAEEDDDSMDGQVRDTGDDNNRSRSRSRTTRRSHKRRSSLEKLHDALREMNFDAVLPLGPRRAASIRIEEPSTEQPPDSISASIQNVIDNTSVESEKEDQSPSEPMEEEELPEETSSTEPIVVKGKRGRKRKIKGKIVNVVKKRGRKPGSGAGSVSVSAKAALVAVSAIITLPPATPSVQVESGNDETISLDPNPPSSSAPAVDDPPIKRRGRKPKALSLIENEPKKSPEKKTLPTRNVPAREANKDGRVTRSMIKPAPTPEVIDELVSDEKIESAPCSPIVQTMEDPDPPEVAPSPEEIPASPETKKPAASPKRKTKAITPEPSPIKDSPSPPPSEDSDIASVFLFNSALELNTSECISSHDKLLHQSGTTIPVRKVFSEELFSGFLQSLNAVEPTDQTKPVSVFNEEKVVRECMETLEWMLSVIQFKETEEDSIVKVEDCASELYQLPDLVDIKPPLLNKCNMEIDDEDDEDDDVDNNDDYEQERQKDYAQVNGIDCSNGDFMFEEDSGPGSNQRNFSEENDLSESSTNDNDFPVEDSVNSIAPGSRKANLDGVELYRCGNENCNFKAMTGAAFTDHALSCALATNEKFQCFHCERRLKSIISLMEHLKIHGKPRQLCSLCDFRGWFTSDIVKHLKSSHKVYNCKTITEARGNEDPVNVTYPKAVANRLTLPNDLLQNHILYTSKVQFQPTDIDSIPKSSIFTSLLHCAVCEYATKVRSNIIRHLALHSRSDKDGGSTPVPNKAPVNPVPCLERKELMFDKMTNWAGSSHATKIGGVSKEDTLKLPKFVVEQFRYVCSLRSCKQITGQDDILCAHMKALHFKEKFYACPHCQDEEGTRMDPRNIVLIEKIPHHLKLHGPRLSKCGHCDYIHYSSTAMEKHVATKHVEKKPIFYLIRDLDNDGNANRRSSIDDPEKGSHERWRCNLCKAQLNCWEEAKSHCSLAHKLLCQFQCTLCQFGSDSIYAIASHLTNKTCGDDSIEPHILIAFLRNEAFEGDAKNEEGHNVPIWRRNAPRVKHIRGIFLDDENTRPLLSSSVSTPKVKTEQKVAFTTPTPGPPTPVKSSAPPVPLVLMCPSCNLFKAKSPADLKLHLFNELNYERYQCSVCNIRFVTADSLKAHMNMDHKVNLEDEAKVTLPADEVIEAQVYDMVNSLLKSQQVNAEDKDGRNIESLLCKHCYLHFSSFHNYRTHILAKHIGSERFKCKYCNAGFWHEAMVKQHHFKSSHADQPLQVVRNNEFEQLLTPEFWFKEYGIPHNKSVNSASIGRPGEEEEGCVYQGRSLQCSHCDFKTDSSPALQKHKSLHPAGSLKQAKRRSVASASDTDKEECEEIKSPGKKSMKYKELSTVYKCEHCAMTNFTKRGIRSHWCRSHAMEELPCRYYECKSFDDNFKLTDGYILKCQSCEFQTSSVEHYQTHHDLDHPGKAFRFKRRKRNEFHRTNESFVDVYICSYCFCELDTLNKLTTHSQTKHPGLILDYNITTVPTKPASDAHEASKKLIEESVNMECPACHKACESIKEYSTHFVKYHHSETYVEPSMRFTRVYSDNHDDLDIAFESAPSNSKVPRLTPSSSSHQKEVVGGKTASHNNSSQPVKQESNATTVIRSEEGQKIYKCPKCDFKSYNYEFLSNKHLLTHLLAYRCPECNLAFHLHMDAQFHIRHFHGIPRIRASHNGEAYIEFSTLKDKITQILPPRRPSPPTPPPPPPPPKKNVIVVTLSDEEDFDGAPEEFQFASADDLDELDVDDVRLLLG